MTRWNYSDIDFWHIKLYKQNFDIYNQTNFNTKDEDIVFNEQLINYSQFYSKFWQQPR